MLVRPCRTPLEPPVHPPTQPPVQLPFAVRSHAAARARAAALLLGGIALTGCGGGSEGPATSAPRATGPALVSVSVSVASLTLHVGDTTTASAVGILDGGGQVTLGAVWSTTMPDVASVSASGIVTARSAGQAKVIARVDGKEGDVLLTVLPPPVARVALSVPSATVAPTVTLALTAALFDAGGGVLSDRPIAWSSSDPSKATVSQSGEVTGVAQGSAVISATSEGVSASAAITVSAAIGAVARITITAARTVLEVGERVQLAATLRDGADNVLTGHPVQWAANVISGSGVATVSPAGVLTAVSPGSLLVEAISEGVSGRLAITVLDDVDASIVVAFADPVPNEIVGDSVAVYVGVEASERIDRVQLQLGARVIPLLRTAVGARGTGEAWTASLDITDLHYGIYEMVAIATDVMGSRGMGSVVFERDTRKSKGGTSVPPKQK